MNPRYWHAAIVHLALLAGSTAAPQARAEEKITFEQHVRPVLKVSCLDCHGGGEKLKGGLDLRLRRSAVRGGKSGPAIAPGDAAKSLLVERLRAGEMPRGDKKVPAEPISVVERWIAAGAPAGRQEPAKLPPGIDITPEERAYWFYQPIRRVTPRRFSIGDRVRTPIDA